MKWACWLYWVTYTDSLYFNIRHTHTHTHTHTGGGVMHRVWDILLVINLIHLLQPEIPGKVGHAFIFLINWKWVWWSLLLFFFFSSSYCYCCYHYYYYRHLLTSSMFVLLNVSFLKLWLIVSYRLLTYRPIPRNNNSNNNNNNNNKKYISRALNPSVSNLTEAQSAVHVQLKLSKLHIQLKPRKQRNQRRQKTKQNKQTNKSRWWAGKGARSKYQVNN